jgi:hypothetical protein
LEQQRERTIEDLGRIAGWVDIMPSSITTISEAAGDRVTRDRTRPAAQSRRRNPGIAWGDVVDQHADAERGRDAANGPPENLSRPFSTRSRNESIDDSA